MKAPVNGAQCPVLIVAVSTCSDLQASTHFHLPQEARTHSTSSRKSSPLA